MSLCLAVDMRRQYVSNFTGSAGTAIVTHDQVPYNNTGFYPFDRVVTTYTVVLFMHFTGTVSA